MPDFLAMYRADLITFKELVGEAYDSLDAEGYGPDLELAVRYSGMEMHELCAMYIDMSKVQTMKEFEDRVLETAEAETAGM